MLLGLIGKPSCGKSTFFKAATMADVLIANYPFATIKPNHGIGYVRIECLEKMSKLKPNDFYPPQQLADIYLNELDDIEQAKIYQNKANKINKYG